MFILHIKQKLNWTCIKEIMSTGLWQSQVSSSQHNLKPNLYLYQIRIKRWELKLGGKKWNKNSDTVSDTWARISDAMTESVLWTVVWIVLICTAKLLTVITIVFSHSTQQS